MLESRYPAPVRAEDNFGTSGIHNGLQDLKFPRLQNAISIAADHSINLQTGEAYFITLRSVARANTHVEEDEPVHTVRRDWVHLKIRLQVWVTLVTDATSA